MSVQKKKNLRLHFRLKKIDTFFIAVVSCLMLFVLMLFGAYTSNVKTNEEQLISLVLERMSSNQKSEVEKYIAERTRTLKGLAGMPEVYRMKDAEIKGLLKGNAKDFGFEYFFIMKADGTGYYFDEGEVYREQGGEPFFEHIMSNEVYVTEPFYSDKSPAITTICVSVRTPSGRKEGVLCAALNLEQIQTLIQNSEMVLDGSNFILNQAGNYIASNKGFNLHNESLGIFQVPNSDITLIDDVFATRTDKAGQLVINNISYKAYVSYLSDFNWVIVQSIPESEVTARFQYIVDLQRILTFLSIALLLCIARIIYSWRKSDRKIYKDVLTSCNSRAACISLLENLKDKNHMRISIIYMDLNNFKFVNDTYGHDEGDRLLRIFGTTLKEIFGHTGFVGRIGGDEFISVQADTSDEEIQAMCRRTEQLLSQKCEKLPFQYRISSSYGYVSREVGESTSLDDLLQLADTEMYQNKTLLKSQKHD